MKAIVAYLLFMLSAMMALWAANQQHQLPSRLPVGGLPFQCVLIGGVGGVVYCLRAVYQNACVRKSWDSTWQPWYYIRPFVSLVTGGVSWLFLKAGLLVLGATREANSNSLGFLALAFIAGYNVDRFLGKLEELSEATFGIKRSRSSTTDESEGGQ